ncbi:hypothetical protein C8Q77DRAFT_482159 [Trametes polyzona]|nr:hypothetical protein C8Q77DRAFT_482159 [Trametes polyzona]
MMRVVSSAYWRHTGGRCAAGAFLVTSSRAGNERRQKAPFPSPVPLARNSISEVNAHRAPSTAHWPGRGWRRHSKQEGGGSPRRSAAASAP